MDFNQYQQEAKKTLVKHSSVLDLAHIALGLNGEAGEVAEKIKKVIRDKGGEYTQADLDALVLEAGDILWHVAILADMCGITLEDVAKRNISKLQSRKSRGKISGSGDYR